MKFQLPAREQLESMLRHLVTGVGTSITGYMVGKGYITTEQNIAIIGAALGLIPVIVSVVYAFKVSNPEAQATKLTENHPQVIMDAVVKMDGVTAIVAEKRYADANPNPGVMTAADAKRQL